MVFQGKIDCETRAYVKYLAEFTQLSLKEIADRTQISRTTLYRILHKKSHVSTSKSTLGRPRKVTARGERAIKKSVSKTRLEQGTVSAQTILSEAGIDVTTMCLSTVRRTLNRIGFKYLVARPKGLLTTKDMKLRVAFAKKIKATQNIRFWKDDLCFYFDAVSFVHKYNPYAQAIVPGSHIWRMQNEGLAPGCTRKGHHVGTGGRTIKYFVAISYKVGVIFCHEYEHLSGKSFHDMIANHFDTIFVSSKKPHSKLFLQDGDPSQNSVLAKKALKCIKAKIFTIPPRSPDLNPIENFFHQVKKKLRDEALKKKIEHETPRKFAERIKSTIYAINQSYIDNLISSMNGRIDKIIKNGGRRLRY